ncbi:MAG: DUF3800 domain-containing protein [Demequinaceae bacterium]|nr:DUF3800 domain-containing protein [Demequinaceae bacterium]
MRLAYIDESYDRERFVLAVVLVHPEDVPTICASLDAEAEWAHGTFGIPRDVEIHAQQVMQDKGDWSPLRSDTRLRLRLAHRLLTTVASSGARVFVVAYSAPDHTATPLNAALAYRMCLDTAIRVLGRKMRERQEHVLLVADDVSGADDYRDDFLHLRGGMEALDRPSRLLDTIYFVPSRSSRMIQAADMVAYVARRVLQEADALPLRQPATALWTVIANSATWLTVLGNASAPENRG